MEFRQATVARINACHALRGLRFERSDDETTFQSWRAGTFDGSIPLEWLREHRRIFGYSFSLKYGKFSYVESKKYFSEAIDLGLILVGIGSSVHK